MDGAAAMDETQRGFEFSLRHAYFCSFGQLLAWLSGRTLPLSLALMVSLVIWPWTERRTFSSLREFGAGNLVTSLRVLALPALAACFDAGRAAWAAGVVVGIFAADGCDGWLARRAGKSSAFGARYDSEADAGFVLLLSAGVYQLGRAGAWVAIAGLLRPVYVLVLHWSRQPNAEAPRSRLGRYVFAISVVCLTLSLCLERLSWLFAAAATGLLCYSFGRSFAALGTGQDNKLK